MASGPRSSGCAHILARCRGGPAHSGFVHGPRQQIDAPRQLFGEVAIEHGGDLETRYAHMSRIAVASGQRVRKGDVIGYVGSTGRSTGPHLHYEVRVGGTAVNPVAYMADSGAASGYALAAK